MFRIRRVEVGAPDDRRPAAFDAVLVLDLGVGRRRNSLRGLRPPEAARRYICTALRHGSPHLDRAPAEWGPPGSVLHPLGVRPRGQNAHLWRVRREIASQSVACAQYRVQDGRDPRERVGAGHDTGKRPSATLYALEREHWLDDARLRRQQRVSQGRPASPRVRYVVCYMSSVVRSHPFCSSAHFATCCCSVV